MMGRGPAQTGSGLRGPRGSVEVQHQGGVTTTITKGWVHAYLLSNKLDKEDLDDLTMDDLKRDNRLMLLAACEGIGNTIEVLMRDRIFPRGVFDMIGSFVDKELAVGAGVDDAFGMTDFQKRRAGRRKARMKDNELEARFAAILPLYGAWLANMMIDLADRMRKFDSNSFDTFMKYVQGITTPLFAGAVRVLLDDLAQDESSLRKEAERMSDEAKTEFRNTTVGGRRIIVKLMSFLDGRIRDDLTERLKETWESIQVETEADEMAVTSSRL